MIKTIKFRNNVKNNWKVKIVYHDKKITLHIPTIHTINWPQKKMIWSAKTTLATTMTSQLFVTTTKPNKTATTMRTTNSGFWNLLFRSSVFSLQRFYSIDVLLPSNVVFHWMSSSIECCLTWKIIFSQRMFSIKGCLPSKVLFHQRCLTSKVVLHQRLHSIKGCLPSKVVLHQMSPFIKGRLLSKIVFHQSSSSIKETYTDISSYTYYWMEMFKKLFMVANNKLYFSQI